MAFQGLYRGAFGFLFPFLIGCWLGLTILPKIPFFGSAPPTVEESIRLQGLRIALAKELATTLKLSPDILDAQVHLGTEAASVTVEFDKGEVGVERLDAIAAQLAASVEGLPAGRVSIFSRDGTQLNWQANESYARQQWWTDLLIVAAKVLGIVAMLIILRYIIQAVGAFEKSRQGAQAG